MEDTIYSKYLKEPSNAQPRHFESESEMALSSLINIIELAGETMDAINEPVEIPAWVQSKIAVAEDYLESISSFMKHRDTVDIIQGDE